MSIPCGPDTICDVAQGVCVLGNAPAPDFRPSRWDLFGPSADDGPPRPLTDGPAPPPPDARLPVSDGPCADPLVRCAGVCTNVQTDAKNCGQCGLSCGANATCSASACACTGGFHNCNSSWGEGDGCECAPSRTCSGATCTGPDPCAGVNCGSNASCSAGTCGCTGGSRNCDGAWGNGCECPSTKVCQQTACVTPDPCAGKNCGANSTCDPATGNCGCATGYRNCNGSLTDGCEIHVAGDTDNCGSCGHVCTCPPNNEPLCAGHCKCLPM